MMIFRTNSQHYKLRAQLSYRNLTTTSTAHFYLSLYVILETNLCINHRDQSLYRSKISISMSLPEIDLQDIDLSIDLRINIVLI